MNMKTRLQLAAAEKNQDVKAQAQIKAGKLDPAVEVAQDKKAQAQIAKAAPSMGQKLYGKS